LNSAISLTCHTIKPIPNAIAASQHPISSASVQLSDRKRIIHTATEEQIAANGCNAQLSSGPKTDAGRNRSRAIEDNLFSLGQLQNSGQACPDVSQIDAALISARVFTLESKQLQLLTLYEQRINRSLQKNLAMLQSLQAARKSAHEAAMKEAAALLQLSEMRGLEYFPSQDGFLFSTAQIHAAIDRDRRLQRALTTDFSKHKPRKFHLHAV
jgi:hypothetical protein